MREAGKVIVACALAALSTGPGMAWAEVVDVIENVPASATVGATATLTVTPKRISDNSVAAGLSWGAVSLGATPWNVAPQYLEVLHESNHSNWAIRILTNNRATHPTMAGKVLDPKGAGESDDILGYGGLIGSNANDVNARPALGWQVYKDPVPGGPAAPVDASATPAAPPANDCNTGTTCVGSRFNSPWAFMADASDCPSTATTCRSATPPTIDKTIEFLRIAQGDAAGGFLLGHPSISERTADGDIAVYLTGRFLGMPADTYSTTVIVELYHF